MNRRELVIPDGRIAIPRASIVIEPPPFVIPHGAFVAFDAAGKSPVSIPDQTLARTPRNEEKFRYPAV